MQPPTQPHAKRRALSNEQAVRWQGERPWPVKALTWLLALETVALGALAFIYLQGSESIIEKLAERPFFAAFVPLSLLALLATLGFLRLRPGAWVIAMLVQGLMLLAALLSYFGSNHREPVVFATMFYGVVMVVYLNYADVPLVFRVQPGAPLVEDVNQEPAP